MILSVIICISLLYFNIKIISISIKTKSWLNSSRSPWTLTNKYVSEFNSVHGGSSWRYLWHVHVALVHQGRKFTQHRLQRCRFDAGSVMRDQSVQTRQRAELQSPLVLPQEGSQHRQSFRQDGRQVDLERMKKRKEWRKETKLFC